MHDKKKKDKLNDVQLGMPGSGPLRCRKWARQIPAQGVTVLVGAQSAHPGDAGRRPCRAGGCLARVGCSLADVQVVQDESGGSQLASVSFWQV